MNPQQEQNNTSPQSNGVNPDSETTPITVKKRHTGLALFLLIGPSALIILAIIIAAVSNFAFSATASNGEALFPDENPIRTIINIIVFLMGAVSVITWLPGIIIGIILLNKKKYAKD